MDPPSRARGPIRRGRAHRQTRPTAQRPGSRFRYRLALGSALSWRSRRRPPPRSTRSAPSGSWPATISRSAPARVWIVSKAASISGRLVMICTGWRVSTLREKWEASGVSTTGPRPAPAAPPEDRAGVRVVRRREPRERLRVGRLPEGVVAAEGPRPERDFVPLDPILRAGEQAVPGPVVEVEVSDERDGHVARLDARALDHRRRAHVV